MAGMSNEAFVAMMTRLSQPVSTYNPAPADYGPVSPLARKAVPVPPTTDGEAPQEKFAIPNPLASMSGKGGGNGG